MNAEKKVCEKKNGGNENRLGRGRLVDGKRILAGLRWRLPHQRIYRWQGGIYVQNVRFCIGLFVGEGLLYFQ